ncbi:MAG: hypothetical protein GF311_13840 [Candidatus Lokiarchaeota archaeon]|nr:hypothetical protein [Candidatus Lokiarchaeota archaeon]
MVKISIDWVKAEKKPNRSQRVKGKHLLELRTKIADLEHQLQKKLTTVTNLSEEVTNLNMNISQYEMFLRTLEKMLKTQNTLTLERFEQMKKDLKQQLV